MFSSVLPKVVADTGAGGGIPTAVSALNALSKQNLENKIEGTKADYAPLTTQAEAASKLAYANLMGPQFLSKLMGNQDILANIPDAQKTNILKMLQAAGTGQGTGNSLLSSLNSGNGMPQQNQSPSLTGTIRNALKGLFSGGASAPGGGASNAMAQQQQPQPQQAAPQNALAADDSQLTPNDQNQINNLKPGQSYQIPQNANSGATTQPPAAQSDNKTFAENVGDYKGVVKEGEEVGKNRADDVKALNDLVFNGETHQTTLDSISDILASPEFEQIRTLPLAGHRELQFYSKEGTPAQQNMVGKYYTLTGNLIKDSARDFQGQFRKGEQQLLEGMKPSPADTVDTARGKVEALSTMNKMLTERSRLTSQLMTDNHMSKLQASEIADQQLATDQIKKHIHDQLNPKITVRNRKTGETKTMTPDEARKLGVSDV